MLFTDNETNGFLNEVVSWKREQFSTNVTESICGELKRVIEKLPVDFRRRQLGLFLNNSTIKILGFQLTS